MTTAEEIGAAVARLPEPEFRRFLDWLEAFRNRRAGSGFASDESHQAANLDAIVDDSRVHFPNQLGELENSFERMLEQLSDWPQLGRRISRDREVRRLTAGRFPLLIYYRVRTERIQILRIRHTDQAPLYKA